MLRSWLVFLLLVKAFAGVAQAQVPATRAEALAAVKALDSDSLPKMNIFFEGDLQEQIADAVNGPQFDKNNVGDFVMITGCRPRSCPEKATLVYKQDALVAIVLTHSRCVLFASKSRCASRPVNTVIGREMASLQKVIAAVSESPNFRPSNLEPSEHQTTILISLPDWGKKGQ
jgi:hypothetical protein